MNNPFDRIRRLFFQKLVADEPNHPWLNTPEAQDALHNWTWKEPRRVGVWWWMDVEIMDGSDLVRGGRVSWHQDGTGYYDVEIAFEREGVGLVCWPSFRALSEAQEFVEQLMCMSLEEARDLDGQQWPGVVL
jgi:hypothetical protein